MAPVRFRRPKRINMKATDSSIVKPSAGGMVSLSKMIAEPTRTMVTVCPIPQSAPTTAACSIVRSRLTMVVTATT